MNRIKLYQPDKHNLVLHGGMTQKGTGSSNSKYAGKNVLLAPNQIKAKLRLWLRKLINWFNVYIFCRWWIILKFNFEISLIKTEVFEKVKFIRENNKFNLSRRV